MNLPIKETEPETTQLQATRREGATGPRLARYRMPLTEADFQALNEGQADLWLTLRRRPPSLTIALVQPGRRFVGPEDRAVACWLLFPEDA